MRGLSEESGRADSKDGAFETAGVEAEGAVYGRAVDADDLGVEAVVARIGGVPIDATESFVGRPGALGMKLRKDPRRGAIDFDFSGNEHVGSLNVEALIADGGDGERAVGDEVVEQAVVAFTLQPETFVFDSTVGGEKLVGCVEDGDAWSEGAGLEEKKAIAEANAGVIGEGGTGGVEAIFATMDVAYAESGRQLFVVFVVAKGTTRAELAGGGHPDESNAGGEVAGELDGLDAELAEIVADHEFVVELCAAEFAFGKSALGEEGAEEFVGHDAIVGSPVGMGALHGDGAGEAVPASAEEEMFVHGVVESADDGNLRGVVYGPEGDVVIELGIVEEAGEVGHDAMKLEILTREDGLRVAEVVDEGLVGGHLVEIASDEVAADVKFGALGFVDVKALARLVEIPGRFFFELCWRGRGIFFVVVLLLLLGLRRFLFRG